MKKIIFALAASLLLFSCAKESAPAGYGEGEGSLTLGVDLNDEVRAALSADELLATSQVKIYYADFSGLVRSYVYSELEGPVYLPVGQYRADVIAGEAAKSQPRKANFEQKSYYGSKEFSITKGLDTPVQVEAKVSNVVSKVTFDSTVGSNFQDGYKLSIGVGDDVLEYTVSENGKEGYFIVNLREDPVLSWKFTGKLAKDGSDFTKSGTVSELKQGTVYAFNLKYTVKDGEGKFDVLVDYSTQVISDVIVFEPVSTGLSASSIYETWACHTTVHADVDEGEFNDPSKIKFEYSSDLSNWTPVDAVRVEAGIYKADIKELTPQTTYSYRLVIDGEVIGDPMQFTTEAAPQVPNGGFEETSKSKSGNFYEWYNANATNPADRTPWWGSGNGSSGIDNGGDPITGSADFGGFIISKADTGTKHSGNQSACCQSMWALVKFAAGNIFTGYFAGLVGTQGGMVNFGRPFTARPTALRFYMKYSTGKMNRIGDLPSGVSLTKNDYDRCKIHVALGTWSHLKYGGSKDCPFQVNTTDAKTLIDLKDVAETLAYGELIVVGDADNSTNVWKQVTIPLEYFNTNKYPTHIIISAAASQYGDYFSGCDETKLWLDDMEFVYE